MAEFAYAGSILRVDLTRLTLDKSATSDYSGRFLGGRGIAARIYWDEAPPGTTAYGSENRLIFMTGPMAGFPGLAGSRWQICGKSPATSPESFSYANLGGSWGAHLKFAGYDGIVVQGQSEKPVYLLIQDGNVEIKDASFIWGKGAIATRNILKQAHGSETRVAAIGPAGENRVGMAIVLADEDSAGSAGFGAVMGAKRLKAIAVKGRGKLAVANPEKLSELRKRLRELRKDAPTIWAGGYHSPYVEANPRLRRVACWGCISGCTRAVYRADDGREGKFNCQTPFAYMDPALRYYGKQTDVPFYATKLCDDYGIDVMSLPGFMIWLWRCSRRGTLSDESTGIPISKLGSLEFIETLVRKLSLREGFGEIMAQGIFQAADAVGGREHLGGELCKTGHVYIYAPRLYIITGLLYATEPRVPIQQLHQVSFLIHEWLDWYNKRTGAFLSTEVLKAIARKFFGSETTFDFSTYQGKALAAWRIQDREYAKECLIFCDFSWPMRYIKCSADHIGDPALESQVFSLVTGTEMDEERLVRIGERVFNLQRAIMVRDGHRGRDSDVLPETDFTVPLKLERGNPDCLVPAKGDETISRKGAVVERQGFEQVKDEYYQMRGWDVKTGLQTKRRLHDLELDDVARELAKKGLAV